MRMSSLKPQEVNWLPWSEWMIEPVPIGRDSLAMTTASLTRAVSQRRSMAQPTTRRLKASRTTAAVDLALARRVLGDVGQPEHVGPVHGEVALDQVLFGGLR